MRISLRAAKGEPLLNTIVQPLWDEVLIGIANAGSTYLFVTGQSATKTLIQTNLALGGQITKPDQFYLRGFMVYPVARSLFTAAGAGVLSDLTDVQRFLDQSIFRFSVGSSGAKIVEGHPILFPAGLGLDGMVATGGNTTAGGTAFIVGNGKRSLDNRFGLGADYAELLDANEGFRGELFWPTTVTNSNSFSCRVYLPGLWGQGVK